MSFFSTDPGTVSPYRERSTSMFKLAVRYGRYALSMLASLGFSIGSN
jgi:hypothetical protein